jgi:hypothetical protein
MEAKSRLGEETQPQESCLLLKFAFRNIHVFMLVSFYFPLDL